MKLLLDVVAQPVDVVLLPLRGRRTNELASKDRWEEELNEGSNGQRKSRRVNNESLESASDETHSL